jgi:hypothetical protein
LVEFAEVSNFCPPFGPPFACNEMHARICGGKLSVRADWMKFAVDEKKIFSPAISPVDCGKLVADIHSPHEFLAPMCGIVEKFNPSELTRLCNRSYHAHRHFGRPDTLLALPRMPRGFGAQSLPIAMRS